MILLICGPQERILNIFQHLYDSRCWIPVHPKKKVIMVFGNTAFVSFSKYNMFMFGALIRYICNKRMEYLQDTNRDLERQVKSLESLVEEYRSYPICYICEENPVNVALRRCKHARICRECWQRICKTTGRVCPDCRKPNNSAMSIILPLKEEHIKPIRP